MKNLRVRITGERLTDWQTYHNIVAEQLRSGMRVLEVGCGRGDVAPFPWGSFPDVELTGLDTDPAAGANPFLTHFVGLGHRGRWPLASETFDLVVCRYVLEHVDDPARFLGNIQRVLKKGGLFISLTPNARHPQILVARLLPLWLKSRILQATKGIRGDQVFPTFYRLNSPPCIAHFAQRHGFEISVLLTKEFVPSTYLDFSFVGFLLSWAYFMTMVKTGWERYFGAQIIAVLRNGARRASWRPIFSASRNTFRFPSNRAGAVGPAYSFDSSVTTSALVRLAPILQ